MNYLSWIMTMLQSPSILVIALSYLSSLPTSYTMIFFSLESQFFREASLLPCHLFSSQRSTWPPLLSLHTLLLLDSVVGAVLGVTSLFEGTRIRLVPADLISPSSCFPRRTTGQRHRVAGQWNVIWGGKGCAIPLASQGSEPQQTNCWMVTLGFRVAGHRILCWGDGRT